MSLKNMVDRLTVDATGYHGYRIYIIIITIPEELNDLYCSPNIVRVIKSRRMRWAGHVTRMEEGRGVYRFMVGKPEGKRPLGRTRRRWEDNIKMDLQEVGCGVMDYGPGVDSASIRNEYQEYFLGG